ncbi:MAG: tRNA (adenosine(37)-N6)-threonylcarbamoyltransferase complex transferase subunit TsaD [candidate division WOR-3 bacterium]
MIILGIETSCDETGVALLEDERVLCNKVYSQEIHGKFGGVVPEIASREHVKRLLPMTKEVLEKNGVTIKDIDGIAVTYGPGLVCSLLVGVNFAKALSYSAKITLVGVNHLEAHIYSSFIYEKEWPYPFLSLLVSGGHTLLVKVNGFRNYEILGSTLDDACGESFDKVSKLIGLGYPGGPAIEKWAKEGKDDAFIFPLPDPPGLDFSYSGLKTSVLYTYLGLPQEEKIYRIPDIAASFQKVAIESLIIKIKRAVKLTGIKKLAISGGVSANKLLRERLGELNVEWIAPKKEFTIDNGAMVGFLGYKLLKRGITSKLDLKVSPNLFL